MGKSVSIDNLKQINMKNFTINIVFHVFCHTNMLQKSFNGREFYFAIFGPQRFIWNRYFVTDVTWYTIIFLLFGIWEVDNRDLPEIAILQTTKKEYSCSSPTDQTLTNIPLVRALEANWKKRGRGKTYQ